MNQENFRYKIKQDKLVAVGDLHGNWTPIVNFCESYQNFCLISVGDFGVGFLHKIKEFHALKHLDKWLKDSNNTLLVLRGNHDNPSYFNGKWRTDNILFLQDYHVLTFGDKQIQCIGGGISIDRSERILNRSWWLREEVDFRPDRVEKVDILITHVAPTRTSISKAGTNQNVSHYHGVESMQGGDLFGDLRAEQVTVQKLSDLSECKKHYFGHYHFSSFTIDFHKNREYIGLSIDEFREIR